MKKTLLVVLVTIAALSLALPVMADLHYSPEPGTTVTLYGQARLSTTYMNNDMPSSDDSEFVVALAPNSRIGLKIKKSKLFGHWEVGLRPNNGDSYSRLIYGIWTINDTTSLAVGKMYSSPYWWTHSALLVDNAGIGYGAVYEGPKAQIKLNIQNFYISLGEANTSDLIGGSDIDRGIPKVYAGYNHSVKGLLLHGGVAFNSYNMNNGAFDDKVNSFIVYGHGNIAVADATAIRFSGFYGTNPAEFGILGMNGRAATGGLSSSNVAAVVVGNDIEDTKTFAGFIEVSQKFGKNKAHAGYGYASSDNDAASWTDKDTHQEYWVNVIIPLVTESNGSTLFVVPEVHVFDEKKSKTGATETKSTYVGAKWQFNF